jgi:class 3 adenylate cyclase
LAFVDGNWYVTDCSRRGTFIDDTRLVVGDPTPLRDGDGLRFGECEFTASIGGASAEPIMDADDGFTLTLEDADPASIDASRVLKSALELPELFAHATTEGAIYDASCEYLVNTLFPAIASAYVTLTSANGSTEVLGKAERPQNLTPVGMETQPRGPLVSRRVLQRLRENPRSVLFLERAGADSVLSITVSGSVRAFGAALLEIDALGRVAILHVTCDHGVTVGGQLIAPYLQLIATLVRQHLTTLRRAHLTKFFSPKIIDLLDRQEGRALLEGEPRVITATSLFFDVRGSSLPLDSSAEDLSVVYHDLRQIISTVTDTVFESEGTIIDYAGDGVFAAWGAPLPQANQGTLAVTCALEIAHRLARLPLRVLNTGGSLFGIGIARGDVLAGAVGSSMMFKYGILGPSVNAAHRLMSLTKPDQLARPILMTGAVHSELTLLASATRPVGTMKLPGMVGEVDVYEAVVRRGGGRDD